jgi:predicted  nucleic acid-binding Zn-ribbon protein
MTDAQAKALRGTEPTQEVDRIRDIIFGTQMRDYEQRFQNVQGDLDRLQGEIDRLTEQLSEQGTDQGKRLQNLRQEMRQVDEALRDELRQTAQKLTLEKVDRLALGQLLIEVGTQLKTGGSLSDLLDGLEENKTE